MRFFLISIATIIAGLALLFSIDPGNFIYRAAAAIGIPVEIDAHPGDYFAVTELDPQTFAIGEPYYYQKNISYLIIGTERALLFDSGPGLEKIDAVVRRLTRLPVTVVASHLHYDHVGNIGQFASVAMLDVPKLRAQVDSQGYFTFEETQHLGAVERNEAPKFKIDTWLAPERSIDLGGRRLRVLATPGHTDDSMMLYDEERQQLFTGDFIYPGHLLAILPGARIGAYLDTSRRLVVKISPDAVLYPGHASATAKVWETTRLAHQDLVDLNATLEKLKRGEAPAKGVFPRQLKVNERIALLVPFDWNLSWN